MNEIVRKIGLISAVIAFLLCLWAGLWILRAVGLDTGDDALSTGIGLYFIGKAFFVGPLLLITSLSIDRR